MRGSEGAVALALAMALVLPGAASLAGPGGAAVERRVDADGDAIVHVHIAGFAFDPGSLVIESGDGVEWHNHDFFSHTATDSEGSWDTGVLGEGESATLFFLSGSFNYYCQIHTSMTGTLAVNGGGGNLPPTAAFTSPPEGAPVQGVVSVEGTAADPDGSVAGVEVRIDGGAWQAATGGTSWTFPWDTTTVANGDHTLEARATDDQGLAGDPVARTLGVANPSNAAPTVAFTAPVEGAVVQGMVSVEGTADDPDGFIDHVEVRVDGGAWEAALGGAAWTHAWDASLVTEGPHLLEARAFDDLGLGGTMARRNVTVDHPGGNAAPTAAFTAPGAGATVQGMVSLEGTAADPDGEVAGVEVRIDGGAWNPADGASDWTFAWDTLLVADGPHTLEARATDGEGLSGEPASRQVTVANPPTATILDPLVGVNVQGTTLVTGLASDPGPGGAVASVEVSFDGGPFQPAVGTSAWAIAWDTTTVADGARRIEVRAFDAAGNVGTVSRDAQVANPPTVAIASPAEGAEVEGIVPVAGSAADPGPGGSIAGVEVRVDGGPWLAATGGEDWTFAWDSRTVADGPHSLEARSHDGMLFSAAAVRHVEVDNRHPDLVVSALVATSGPLDATIDVTVANLGDEAAGPFDVSLQYAGAAGLGTIGTASLAGLAIGGSATVTLTWDTLGKLGNFTLIATADPAGVVEEHDEDNNVREGRVCVPGLLDVGCLLPQVELR